MIGLGETLMVARKAQGLTRDDVCGQLGITQAALSQYENDQLVPDDEILANFAKIYEVTVGFLRYGQRMQGGLDRQGGRLSWVVGTAPARARGRHAGTR
jgi:transcriptional regulator with XRE-family HTH domain